MSVCRIFHLCPECRDGKCRNCDGAAWCDEKDIPAACGCRRDHADPNTYQPIGTHGGESND